MQDTLLKYIRFYPLSYFGNFRYICLSLSEYTFSNHRFLFLFLLDGTDGAKNYVTEITCTYYEN